MIIYVKVKPGSGKEEIEKSGNKYLVYLKERAENNKANVELIKVLSKYFKGCKIKIKAGLKNKNKILEIL